MRVLKAKNAGLLPKKFGYYAGISKGAIPFPPFSAYTKLFSFHSICKLALPCPVKKQVLFLFYFTNIFNSQHMMFKCQFLFLEPFCNSFLQVKKKHRTQYQFRFNSSQMIQRK